MDKDKFSTPNPRELKAGVMLRGDTLSSWAKRHGFPLSTVSMAIHGKRTGPAARRIIEKLNGGME